MNLLILQKVISRYKDYFHTAVNRSCTVHQYYDNLPLEEKRKLYTCGDDFITLDRIPTWDKELIKSVTVGKSSVSVLTWTESLLHIL